MENRQKCIKVGQIWRHHNHEDDVIIESVCEEKNIVYVYFKDISGNDYERDVYNSTPFRLTSSTFRGLYNFVSTPQIETQSKIAVNESEDIKRKSTSDIMEQALQTFKERHAVYGDNYKLAGAVLKEFFPDGLKLETIEDQERYHIFMLIVVKLSRYAINWKNPHQDSIHDAGIYSFMLESIDHNATR